MFLDQGLNPSCSSGNTGSFNPLHQAGDRTFTSIGTRAAAVEFFFFRAAGEAYGSFQARGQIGIAAPSLHHSHNNTGSEPHLQPTLKLTAMPDP